MIKIRELYFEYPGSDFRLSISELDINSGSKAAVIGPSGYGKTTFLNLLSGINTPQKGEIEIDSRNIGSLGDSERRSFRISKIGFVFQNFELVEYLTILDNILLPYRINTSLKLTGEVWSRAGELAKKMGCDVLDAARGIIRLANEHMARALRVISVERGHDPIDYGLLCFGGAGGLHASDLAELLAMNLLSLTVIGKYREYSPPPTPPPEFP